jgi:hypothetical protein
MWAVQLGLYLGIKNQPWYKPPFNSGGESIQDQNWVSFEYCVLWIIANFQFITSVLIFNTGPPFRAPIYMNIPFTLCLIGAFGFDLVWLFKAEPNRDGIAWKGFSLLDYRTDSGVSYYSWRWILFGIIIAQIIANALCEHVFIKRLTRFMDERIERRKHDNFEKIMEHLAQSKLKE